MHYSSNFFHPNADGFKVMISNFNDNLRVGENWLSSVMNHPAVFCERDHSDFLAKKEKCDNAMKVGQGWLTSHALPSPADNMKRKFVELNSASSNRDSGISSAESNDIESKEYVGYFRSYVNGAFGENPPYQIKNSVKKFNTEWDRIIGSKSNVQNYRKSMIK